MMQPGNCSIGKFYVTFSSPSSHIEKISKMVMEKAMVVKGLIKFY